VLSVKDTLTPSGVSSIPPVWSGQTAAIAIASTGVGWLVAASVTGHRYPGLSFAWLVPFLLGAVAPLAMATVAYVLSRKAGEPRPLDAARTVVTPLLVAWLVIGLLLVSTQANHYFANWPRLRGATLGGLGAIAGVTLCLQWVCLLERRYGAVTAAVQRVGVSRTVFAGTLVALVAVGGGHLYTPDEWTIYAAAVGLVHHGVPVAFADEPYPLHHLTGPIPPAERLPDGTYTYAYSKYGIVPTLLTAPLYALARWTGPGPQLPADAFPYGNQALPLVPLLFGPLITAATVALLCRTVLDLGYSRRTALLTAASLGFASLALPYSKTLMNMPLAAGLLLASFWCVVRSEAVHGGPSERKWGVAAGLLAGLAVATRYEALLFVLPIGAFVVRSSRPAALTFAGGFLLTSVPFVLGVNLWRSADIFDFGYRGEGTLSSLAEKPWYGLFGILLSPGCGLVTHTPLMALGLVALAWFWDDAPRPALTAGAIALLAIAYYGSLTTWCGFTAWGPRYLVTVGPFMALPLAALIQRLRAAGVNPFAWLMLGGLALWGLGTNLMAVLVDFNRGWQDHWAFGLTYLEVTWLPFFSGITSHLRLLREWLLDGRGGVDLYLAYAFGGAGWVLVVGLLWAGLTAWAAAWLASGDRVEVREALGGNEIAPGSPKPAKIATTKATPLPLSASPSQNERGS
jgi:hypothetical protein